MNNRQVTGFPKSQSTIELSVEASANEVTVLGETLRLVSTVDCFVDIGPNASATLTSSVFLPARVPEYFTFPVEWAGYKVSAIAVDDEGKLYITPMV